MRRNDHLNLRLAYLLRHDRARTRVDGWLPLAEAALALDADVDRLARLARNDRRRRFQINSLWVRASWGHTVSDGPQSDLAYPPAHLFIAVASSALARALSKGLPPPRRTFLLLSESPESALLIAQGSSAVLVIDTEQAMRHGAQIRRSAGSWSSPDLPAPALSLRLPALP